VIKPRPPYALLHRHYPDRVSVPIEELYQWLGLPEKLHEPGWQNTCAVRVSLALLGAGMTIWDGRTTVRAGKYAQRQIEATQKRLANYLRREWGEPERFAAALAKWRIGGRRGVIAFAQLWGPFDQQGHIDIVAPDQWQRLLCEGSCYWDSVEVSFWELP
jgi:hypothetical protein